MLVHEQVITDSYALYNGDACTVLPTLPANSIGLSIYSPPFAKEEGGSLYFYSSSPRDLSNAATYELFFQHYEFIVREIHRLTLPGRLSAVHCCDVPTGNTGCDALADFPGDIIRLHRQNGFDYTGRYHVWKEPLGVRNRTMAKNLAHKTIVEDSSKCSVASADYLLLFRKKGENKTPIAHPTGLLSYAGERQIPADLLPYRGWTGNQIENRYSQWVWRQYASAFWDDIRISHVLSFQSARDEDDEKHVHPLQLDVIERCLVLWSNPGEIVLDPFGGVGSTAYGAVINGRKGIAIELKKSYFSQMVRNMARSTRKEEQETLFGLNGAAHTDVPAESDGLFAEGESD